MANATSITVNELTANGAVALPTPDVLDTGTDAVTIETASAVPETDKVIMIFENTSVGDTMTVKVWAGDKEPAFRRGIGDLVFTVAGSAKSVLGPLESARFLQSSGKIKLTSTPANTKTQTLKITLLKLPRVV